MKNKCISKEDHYYEAYPRSVLTEQMAISKQKPNSCIPTHTNPHQTESQHRHQPQCVHL
jgi:hypothetical protein